MLPWLGERWGNPSSIHAQGQEAREAVEEARARVAALIGAQPEEMVFVASGTEANNAVLRSTARAHSGRGHLVISTLEHPSIRRNADDLAASGFVVSTVAPDASGVVDPAAVIAVLRPDTRVVCLMLASNEVGTLQPVADVAAECRRRGVAIHCDAVQAAGKIQLDVESLAVDSLAIGAHKFHGPLGAAALWMRPEHDLHPLLLGGGQERRRRASTENVAAIVGFGEVARHAAAELDSRRALLSSLRDRF